MQYITTAAAFLALLGSTFAQTEHFDVIYAPAKGQEVIADGSTVTAITWDPSPEYDGQSVSILLLQGASEGTLEFYNGANVASSIDSALGSYSWTPQSSIAGYPLYGLRLQLDSDPTIFQYSFFFKITAGSGSGSSNKTSSSTSVVASETTSSSAAPTTTISSSGSVVSTKEGSVFATNTSSISVTLTSAVAPIGSGSGSAQTSTLTTATKSTATGADASSSSTAVATAVATAGAGRVVAAGGFAVFGGVMAMVAL